jgi:hypothetical protein
MLMLSPMQELKASLELNKPGLVTTSELQRQLEDARQAAHAQLLEAEAQYIAQVIFGTFLPCVQCKLWLLAVQ